MRYFFQRLFYVHDGRNVITRSHRSKRKAIGRSEIKRKFSVTGMIKYTNVSVKVKQCPIWQFIKEQPKLEVFKACDLDISCG